MKLLRTSVVALGLASMLAGCIDMPGLSKDPPLPPEAPTAAMDRDSIPEIRAAERADDRLEVGELVALGLLFGGTGALAVTSPTPGVAAVPATALSPAVPAIPPMGIPASVGWAMGGKAAGVTAVAVISVEAQKVHHHRHHPLPN